MAALSRCLALAALCCGLAAAQSVSSCGGPTDHLSNVKIAISPDPISRGTPFTFTMTGTLDEDLVGGSLAVDLELKALGIIDKAVKKTITYSLSPGLRKGDQKIVVGPIQLPSEPGAASITGQVHLTNTKGEPVSCVNLNLQVPAMAAAALEAEPLEPVAMVAAFPGPVSASLCAKPTDHLKNVHSSTSGAQTTLTATLDEDLTTITANLDLSIHALFVHLPLKLSIPVSYSPGFQKADWTIVSSETGAEAALAAPPVSVTGQVVVNDGKNEEVTCVSLDETAALVV